jgi:hypothetical protein
VIDVYTELERNSKKSEVMVVNVQIYNNGNTRLDRD